LFSQDVSVYGKKSGTEKVTWLCYNFCVLFDTHKFNFLIFLLMGVSITDKIEMNKFNIRWTWLFLIYKIGIRNILIHDFALT
jgi:hypothetical protein